MRQTKKKKPKDLKRHAVQRFTERYGQEISHSQIDQWNIQIRKKDNVQFIKKQSHTRTVYLIEDKYYAVYNKNLNCICTFLTKDMLESDYIYFGKN